MDPWDRFCGECGAGVADQRRDRVEIDIGIGAGVSDRGRRHHRNEDALALRGLSLGAGHGPVQHSAVAVVCDGVSSAARPDEASKIAAEVVAEALVTALRADDGPAAATREAIYAAGRAVAELAYSDGVNPSWAGHGAPACTVVCAMVTGGAVTVGWVGDSRAYWIPRTRADSAPPIKLTEDDSWLNQVLAAGTLTPAQAAADRRVHAITAWLGADADLVEPHVVTIEPEGPGIVVVCTDGLWNYLDDVNQLAGALPAGTLETPLNTARRLVEIALHRGGRDNITVAVLGVRYPPPLARTTNLG
ncbi:MAG: PP2C family protein-serine/threonine phosphatase [Pseudonocardiaceae bacterium]